MKKNLYLLLLTALVSAAGCKKVTTAPPPLPVGKFTGVFTRIHYSNTTHKLDTATANLTLNLSASTGYSVTGDTTTVHAGSHGSYVVDGYNIQFIDQTLKPNTPLYPGKTHLAGIFNYVYTDTRLQFGASNDTLYVSYNLQPQ
ncbi:MAG: hypothetical protein ABI367_07310 [Mucilaginibacter sp.]